MVYKKGFPQIQLTTDERCLLILYGELNLWEPLPPPTMLRLLITLCLALPLAAADTAWQVRTWVTDDGLPNNDVVCATQHPDGTMLVATRAGLSRFDGLRFHDVKVRASRGGSVGAVLPADDGSLWMVTNSLIAHVEASGHETTLAMPALDLPGSRETAFFRDQTGAMWLCFEGGRFHRIQNGHIEQVAVAEGLSPTFASNAVIDAHGQIWACGPKVLAKWQNDRFEPVAELPKDRCMITRAAAGGVWIGAGRVLLRHTEKDGLQTIAEMSALPSSARISRLHEDAEGRLWIGTFGSGLWLFQDQGFKAVELPNRDVWWLSEDREGSLWLGTGGGGVCRVRPQFLTMLDEPGSPLGEVARAICTDRNGDLWVATQNARLFTRRAGQWRELAPGIDWPSKKAVRVTSGPNGDVWIGTGDGDLVHWGGAAFQNILLPSIDPKLGIVSILPARNGDLWVARSYSVWHRHGDEWRDVVLQAGSGEASTIIEDREGRIWAGTARGMLLREEGGRFIRVGADELTCAAIRSLLIAPDGALLLGTQGSGIVHYAKGRFTPITRAHGLPHPNVSQLVLDEKGRLWAGGDAGLFTVSYDQITAIVEKRATSLQATVFGRSEGISGLQANASFPGSLLERDGTFWCSTRSGLARIATSRVGLNTIPPSATIETITVNDEEPISGALNLWENSPLTLPPGVNSLAFEFGASSFVAPRNVAFRYQLSGIDNEPRLADADRRVVYGRLPPGDYTFSVRAANNDGLWGTHDTVLNLRVAPFYYETAWFRALILLAAIGLIIFISYRLARARYRRRTEALRREAAVQAERTRIARDMHDQVGASLTQISLLSDIALAQGSDNPQLNRLAETAREAVTALDEIVWAVDPKQDRFDSLLEYLAPQITDLAQAANLRCRLDFPAHASDRHLPATFRHHLFLIIREAVNNTIKHARATELKLRITPTATHLTIEITDNGTGFNPATTGNGLTNMRTRTQELQGTLNIEITTGTRITVTVPWPKS